MPNTTIITQTATSDEIRGALEAIAQAVNGFPEAHVMMACLCMAVLLQYPKITAEQLIEGVKGASEWISLYITTLDGSDVPTV